MKDYVQYLQEVLGLQNVMMTPEPQQSQAISSAPSVPRFFTRKGPFEPQEKAYYELIFLNVVTQSKESIFVPEVNELFEKMKAAMKLRNLQILDLDCTVEDRSQLPSAMAQVCESRVVVVFSSFPKDLGELIYKGPGKWIETYSPAYLLEDPGAKKVVWNDLQKVMKELS